MCGQSGRRVAQKGLARAGADAPDRGEFDGETPSAQADDHDRVVTLDRGAPEGGAPQA